MKKLLALVITGLAVTAPSASGAANSQQAPCIALFTSAQPAGEVGGLASSNAREARPWTQRGQLQRTPQGALRRVTPALTSASCVTWRWPQVVVSLGRREPIARLFAVRAARPDLVEHLGGDQDRARGLPAAARGGGALRARRAAVARDRGGSAAVAAHRLGAGRGARARSVRVRLRARLLGRAVHAVRAGGGAVRDPAALHRVARRACCCPTSRSGRPSWSACWWGSRGCRSRSSRASSSGPPTGRRSAGPRSLWRRSARRSAALPRSGARASSTRWS